MAIIYNVDEFYEYLGAFFTPRAVEEANGFDKSVEDQMNGKFIEEYIFDKKVHDFSGLSDEAKVFSSLKYLLRKTALENNIYWFNPNHKNMLFFDKKTFEKTRYNLELKKTVENFKNYFEKFPGKAYDRDELFDLDAEKWSDVVSALKKYEKKESPQTEPPKKAAATDKPKKARHFKRDYITSYDGMKEIIENQFDNRDIGELPKAWIDMMPENLISIKTKLVNKAFAEFAEKTSSSRDTPGEVFNNEAARLAQKLGVILGDNVKIGYIGQGHYGKAFKIEAGKSRTALKIFHSDNTTTDKEDLERFGHGSTMEIVRAFFASRNSSKKKFARTYMGRIGSEEQKDAYILSEFIDITNAKRGKNKSEILKIGEMLRSGDIKSENMIGNTMIDTGDIILEKSLQNYQTRKMVRKLLNALDKNSIERIKELKEKYRDKEEFKAAKQFIDNELKKRFPLDPGEDAEKRYPFLPENAMRELGISNKKENNNSLMKIKSVSEKNGGK